MFEVNEARVGERSQPVVTEVEKGSIRRFAEALGETHPRYFDEDAARRAGYRSLVAPPTFAITLKRGPAPGLTMPGAGTIHGEQHFTYGAPIIAGDAIAVSSWLADVKVREGSRGRMTLVTVESEGINQHGEMAFQARATLIVTEKVAG
jgi:acyl dehydratase